MPDEAPVITPSTTPAPAAPVAPVAPAPVAPATPSTTDKTPVQVNNQGKTDPTPAKVEDTSPDAVKSWLDTEQKPQTPEEKAAADKAGQKPEVKPGEEAQPIKYEFKPVKGFEAPKDQMENLTKFAQANKLAPEVAQAAFEAMAANTLAAQHAASVKLSQDIADNRDAFAKDPVFGGQNLEKSMALGLRGYNAFKSTLSKPEQDSFDGLMKTNHGAENNLIKKLLIFTGQSQSEDSPRVDHTIASGAKPQPKGFNYEAVKARVDALDAERAKAKQ